MDFNTEFFDVSLEAYIPVTVCIDWRDDCGEKEITDYTFYQGVKPVGENVLKARMGESEYQEWLSSALDDAHLKLQEVY